MYDCEQGCFTDWHDLNQRGGTNQWNQWLLFLLGYTRPLGGSQLSGYSWTTRCWSSPSLGCVMRCVTLSLSSPLPVPKGNRGRIAQSQLTTDLSWCSFKQGSPHTMHMQGQQVAYPTSVKAGFKPPCKPDFTPLKHSQAGYWIHTAPGGLFRFPARPLTLPWSRTRQNFSTKIWENHDIFLQKLLWASRRGWHCLSSSVTSWSRLMCCSKNTHISAQKRWALVNNSAHQSVLPSTNKILKTS